jgi:ribosomal 50S subunit-recycling heat shock protein
MSEPDAKPPGAAQRLDRWLFAVRLFGSRTLAAQAVSGAAYTSTVSG